MKQFLAWVAVVTSLLVSKTLAADNYLADPFDRKPAAKHHNSALFGEHKALAWTNNDKIGQLRGVATVSNVEKSSITPFSSKTGPRSVSDQTTAPYRDAATSAPSDAVKQGAVSAVVVPWDSVTSTTSGRHTNAEGGAYEPTTASSTSQSNEHDPTLPGKKSTDAAGQTGRSNYNHNAPTKVEETPADRYKYSPVAAAPDSLPAEVNSNLPRAGGEAVADVYVPWGSAASRSERYAREEVKLPKPEHHEDESVIGDTSPEQRNYGGPNEEKWSGRRKPIDKHDSAPPEGPYVEKWKENKAGIPQEPVKASELASSTYSQGARSAYDTRSNPRFPLNEKRTAPFGEKNSASHKQDANDKNGSPLSSEKTSSQYGEQRSARYNEKASSPTSGQTSTVPYSGSEEAKHEGDVAAVDVSWETRTSQSLGSASTKARASESERHENPDKNSAVYDGALGPITPQLVEEHTAENPTQIQGYGHFLGNVVPWNEASSLFARDLQAEPSDQQTGEIRVEKSVEESREHAAIKEEEDGVMTMMTIRDENVRWNQDDCHPCDVPTQPPTLAPLYPRENDDYEKHLPIVINENESWKDLNENLPSRSPTKPPEKKPKKDEFFHCTKIIGNYGESYECTTESPIPSPTQIPTDKTCIDVSVEGDATYCIRGPICSGSGSTPSGSLCPVKGDVAVKDCSNNTLPSWTSAATCVAPVDATCSRIKTRAWGCVYGEESNTTTNNPGETETRTQTSTETPSKTPTGTPTITPYEPTLYPTEPETTTPGPTEPTPAPSEPNEPGESTLGPPKPSETDKPTPPPSQPSESTPSPTNSYDEPIPTPAALTTEGGASTSYPTGSTASSSTTTKSATSNTTSGTSSSTKPTGTPATRTSTSSGNNAHANTGTSGADANVAGASTSTGTTSNGASGVLSGGAIAGIIIACIAFVAIIVGAVLVRQRSIDRQREENLFAELSGTGGRSLETDYAAM
ncbi:hypothetical protein PI124_g16954 [Phytophthora idaei]|nr:hypothetical protein PI125_g15460 [Phytophthora idaei]KAG3160622.1 hypothetical protein PI126_g6831 [Phytophthora idaei]KAG3238084.1 hypothetical protein PI124_g16954 [Phytophthora idaei]